MFTGVWVLSGIPWLLNVDFLSDDNIILVAHLGSIAGIISRLLLASIFAKPSLGRATYQLAFISIICSAMLLGIRIEEIFENEGNFYSIRMEDKWVEVYHPFTAFIILISTITLISSFYLGIKLQNTLPDEIIDKNLKFINNAIILLFTSGGLFSVLSVIVLTEFYPNLVFINYITSRLLIALAFVLLARYLSFDPIFVFQERGNFNKFLNDGIIGWIISVNGDMGPDTLAFSPQISQRYNFDKTELTLFSASSLTAIGLTHSFKPTTFIIPFSGTHKLSTINITFQHKDPTLKDPRFKQIALSVYSIVFPMSIMPKIHTFPKAERMLATSIGQTNDIHEFIQKENLDHLTNEILNIIIS